MATVLKVKDLHVSFGALKAVNGVSYELERGECLAIVGESGSGKSVHAFAIMRLISQKVGKIDQGEVEFDQRNLLDMPMREFRSIRGRRISMVFQDPISSLNPVLTIGDQITEVLRHHLNLNARDSKTRAEELLRKVGIPDPARRLDNFPHELSGGMRQRVMIAIALACEPDIVIADEAQVVNLLSELQRSRGLTYLFIAHDLSMVRHISDRIAVMYLGKLVEIASKADLFERARHPYTQALISAVPVPDPKIEANRQRIVLEGDIPSPIDPPKGCVFSSRCPKVQAKCFEKSPTLRQIQTGHRVACHLV